MKREQILKEMLLGLLFPRRCPVCDEIVPLGRYVCEECETRLSYIKEPSCKKCGKQLEEEAREYCMDCEKKVHAFRQGKAVFSYQKDMKESMYRFKYANRREYADFYAKTAAERYGMWIKRKGIDVIIPVPMYGGKKRKRGYNQAESFAKSLEREIKIPADKKLVRRIKNTVPQKQLNDRQRRENLKGAFQLRTNIVKYRKILLVDDIYTTGSTADAVAECLRMAGAKEVYVLSICIGAGY